ncbi:MAG: ubiquinol-cytochrome c reductase iron-sulfur subunit [Gaiellaceae bacterium]
MADELERPGESHEEHSEPHLPSPTIWPFAFAGGIALILVGLIVNLWVTVIGAVIAVVFGFLWIRGVTREVRGVPEEAEEEVVVVEDVEETEAARYPRSKFLEGATLGFGALIGGVITAPVLGFAVLPAFVGQDYPEIDLGPLDEYPEGSFVTATFVSRAGGDGPVTRRTAFVRSNGMRDSVPSFTIISNRCVHLGCPTQPQGPPGEERTVQTSAGAVSLTPVQPSAFGCPCHGGAYDVEGNRTAGPPVRALDRYEYSIKNGSLWLGKPYSVSEVRGEGAEAVIVKYDAADPGVHLDGPEQILYPYVP